jgi:hypothetical protein
MTNNINEIFVKLGRFILNINKIKFKMNTMDLDNSGGSINSVFHTVKDHTGTNGS